MLPPVSVACWVDPGLLRKCCGGEASIELGCWSNGLTFGDCCMSADADWGGRVACAFLFAGLLSVWARGWLLKQHADTARRMKHAQTMNRNYEELSRFGTKTTGDTASELNGNRHDRHSLRRRPVGVAGVADDNPQVCVAQEPLPQTQESSGEARTPTDPDCPNITAGANAEDGRLLERPESRCGCCLFELEGPPLFEVLGFLNAFGLMRWECVSKSALKKSASSLQGLWRLIHVRSLGGDPPHKLARSPIEEPVYVRKILNNGGAWKEWALWRERVLNESEDARFGAANDLIRQLLSIPRRSERVSADLVEQLIEAAVVPLKPCPVWLSNLLTRIQKGTGVDYAATHDHRIAPLSARWHCHILVGAKAILADSNGFAHDQVLAFTSWSMAFSAATGRPSMFLAMSRKYTVTDMWEVDIIYCKIPSRRQCRWFDLCQEVVEIIQGGGGIASALCGAERLVSLLVRATDWDVQSCTLAPTHVLAAVCKDIFGRAGPIEKLTGGDVRQSPVNDIEWAVEHVLQWVIAATCPNPFMEHSSALRAVMVAVRSNWRELFL